MNGLWITQALLMLTSLVVLWSVVVVHPGLLVVLLLTLTGLIINQRQIKQHQHLQLRMSQSGQLSISQDSQQTPVQLQSYWLLPQLLILQLTDSNTQRPTVSQSVHLLCWRQRLGAHIFSNLLVGITQQQESNHDI